jgi:hypothetical protein
MALMKKLLAIVFSLACGAALAQSGGQTNASADSAAKKPATAAKSSSTQKSASSSAKSPSTKKSSGTTHASGKKSSRKKKSSRVKGQQKIDPERARLIQEALIREHYLTGAPSGTWNQESEEAMRKYQADHGWQSKTVPDSRALISLGLGPNHDHLLNPESAMTTPPGRVHTASTPPASQPTAPTSSTPTPPTSSSDHPSPQ